MTELMMALEATKDLSKRDTLALIKVLETKCYVVNKKDQYRFASSYGV